jgi:leucyl-tRNA synthetase
MSKSKNNGVDPQELIDKYGADTARLFVMFASPPEQTLEWNDAGVEGAHRFLNRLWDTAQFNFHTNRFFKNPGSLEGALDNIQSERVRDYRRQIHNVLRQISADYARMNYNTVISGCMKMLNLIARQSELWQRGDSDEVQREVSACAREGLGILLRSLYPACPHISHALWAELGYAAQFGDLLDAPWPAVDEAALVQDELSLMLQVNGKLRGAITVPASADKAAIEAAALASPDFAKFAEGKPAKKVVVVPGRLVNIVI